MAPSKDYEVLEESAKSGSNETASSAGSSTEATGQNESSDFNTSGPATLEPTDDEPLFKTDTIRRPLRTYKAIMTPFTSTEINENSNETSNDVGNVQQMGRGRRICIDLFNRYKSCAIKFRNSKLVYIIQILLISLPLSAMVMGQKYGGSCPASPKLSDLTVFTAIAAFFLISKWIAIRCCHPDDRPCEGQQKLFIFFLFIVVSGLLELEIYFFSQLSPSFEPSAANYCNKVFYDYTYYKFIAAISSMFLIVILYLPDCSSFASGVACDSPRAATCYSRYLEEDD